MDPQKWLVTGYHIYIDDGLDGEFGLAYKAQPSETIKEIAGLTERTIYRLKIATQNKAGLGAFSDPITCFTVTVPGVPG